MDSREPEIVSAKPEDAQGQSQHAEWAWCHSYGAEADVAAVAGAVADAAEAETTGIAGRAVDLPAAVMIHRPVWALMIATT